MIKQVRPILSFSTFTLQQPLNATCVDFAEGNVPQNHANFSIYEYNNGRRRGGGTEVRTTEMIKQVRPILSFSGTGFERQYGEGFRMSFDCRMLHLPDFDVNKPAIPQPLPEMPAETGEAI